MKQAFIPAWLLLTGCAAAQLTGAPLPPPPVSRGATVVVIEPFFEQSGWQTTMQNERVTGYAPSPLYGGGMYGGTGYYGSPMTVQREVTTKPAVARIPALTAEQQIVIREIQRMRPSWQVMSTAALASLSGPLVLVRTIVGDSKVLDSDRTLKNVVCGLGLGIPAPLIKVRESVGVEGQFIRYETDADAIKSHVVRYASQPDFAVDTRGLAPAAQPFALTIDYEEGVFAPDPPRDQTVVNGFAQQVAVAIVALVEGVKPP